MGGQAQPRIRVIPGAARLERSFRLRRAAFALSDLWSRCLCVFRCWGRHSVLTRRRKPSQTPPRNLPFVTSPEVFTVTGSIALAGTTSCLLTLIVLHVLPTGLSPLTNPVSQYGITSYRLGYRVQTIAMGIAAIAAATGISKLGIRGGSLVAVLLAIFGAARLAISWFPMDVPGAAARVRPAARIAHARGIRRRHSRCTAARGRSVDRTYRCAAAGRSPDSGSRCSYV